jgi:hypothetical protein
MMHKVYVRCYAELNDYLVSARRMTTFPLSFDNEIPLKELILLLTLPAEEIDLALVNGESVGLSCIVKDGDRISLYPVFESFDISSTTKVRPTALRQPRFVVDVHLGKLANHLRMFGFDTLYRNDYTEGELIRLSRDERRSLLTRNRRLLEGGAILRGYCVRDKDPRMQLIEVLRRFDLFNIISPFTRCIECNSVLRAVDKDSIAERLPPRVREVFFGFQLCETCDRLYWKGSHYQKMKTFVDDVVQTRVPADAGNEREENGRS